MCPSESPPSTFRSPFGKAWLDASALCDAAEAFARTVEAMPDSAAAQLRSYAHLVEDGARLARVKVERMQTAYAVAAHDRTALPGPDGEP